jgi:hypothetical protein
MRSNSRSGTDNSKSHAKESDKRWVSKVKTVSTFPPEGTFTKEPRQIAEILADKRVSPKGIGSAIRMVQYFINRGGKGLSATRRKKLERAKEILHDKLQNEKMRKKRSPASKKARS